MILQVRCPNVSCGQALTLPGEAGGMFRCPACSTTVAVAVPVAAASGPALPAAPAPLSTLAPTAPLQASAPLFPTLDLDATPPPAPSAPTALAPTTVPLPLPTDDGEDVVDAVVLPNLSLPERSGPSIFRTSDPPPTVDLDEAIRPTAKAPLAPLLPLPVPEPPPTLEPLSLLPVDSPRMLQVSVAGPAEGEPLYGVLAEVELVVEGDEQPADSVEEVPVRADGDWSEARRGLQLHVLGGWLYILAAGLTFFFGLIGSLGFRAPAVVMLLAALPGLAHWAAVGLGLFFTLRGPSDHRARDFARSALIAVGGYLFLVAGSLLVGWLLAPTGSLWSLPATALPHLAHFGSPWILPDLVLQGEYACHAADWYRGPFFLYLLVGGAELAHLLLAMQTIRATAATLDERYLASEIGVTATRGGVTFGVLAAVNLCLVLFVRLVTPDGPEEHEAQLLAGVCNLWANGVQFMAVYVLYRYLVTLQRTWEALDERWRQRLLW